VEPAKLPLDVRAADEAGLYAAPPSHQLAVAASSARYVKAILPALGPRLEALLRRLEETMPSIDRLVLSHGDFSARQLLVTSDGLAVIDFDALRLAPAGLDPATFAAHLVLGPGDLDEASEALEDLVEGYGSRPLGLPWFVAACILRHSRRPFRYLEDHWPERVEGMVTAAEDALRR
jgi:aminoglycoside phosphotransferase (APT) family kinase protein